MICQATFKIGDSEISIPINDIEINDLNAIVNKLHSNKDKLNDVIKLLRTRGFEKSSFNLSKDTLSGQVGNFSIRQLVSEVSNPNLQILKTLNVDSNNILITNTSGLGSRIQFDNDTFKLIISSKFWEESDKKSKAKQIHSFIILNWVQNVLLSENSELKSNTIKTISDTIDDLIKNSDKIKDNRIKNIIKNINEKSGIDKLLTLLAYMYGDTKFNEKTSKFTENLSKFLNDNYILIRPKEIIDPNQSQVAKTLSELIKEDKVYKEDLRGKSLKEMLIEFNTSQQNLYLSIDYVSEDYYKLKITTFNDNWESSISLIGDEYYGKSAQLIESVRGYDIVRINDTYYVGKHQLLHSEEMLDSNLGKFKFLSDARRSITLRYKSSGINFETGKKNGDWVNTSKFWNQLLVSKWQVIKISDGDKLRKGSIIKSLSCPNMIFLHDFDRLRNAWKPSFIRNLKNIFYGDLVPGISEFLGQYNIIDFFRDQDQLQKYKEVLDNSDKLEAFLLRTYDIILSDIDAGIIPKRSNLFSISKNRRHEIIDQVLSEFNNSDYVFHEVVSDPENGEVNVQELQRKEQNYTIPKYNIKQDLLSVINHFREHFGINCNIVTNDEIENGISGQKIDTSAKAFILNGEIYINIDKATSSDVIHEYSHLILGIMKAQNMKQYQDLISIVRQLPDYQFKLDEFRKVHKDTRSEIDLQEEIFVTLFGDFIGNKLSKVYYTNGEINTALKYVKDNFVNFVAKAFMLGDTINTAFPEHLFDMSIQEALSTFGSMLFEEKYTISDELNSKIITLRKTTNLIKSLLKEGNKTDHKKSYLLENCE